MPRVSPRLIWFLALALILALAAGGIFLLKGPAAGSARGLFSLKDEDDDDDTTPAGERVRELRAQLAAEREARQKVETEARDLREKLAPLRENVVVSLGRVQDIGARAGVALGDAAEMKALAARPPASLSPEEKRRLLELQRERADLLGALPEITGFQDHPAEYGQFFRHLVSQAAGLNNGQASQVESYMSQRATLMNQLRLNAGSQPQNPAQQDDWETLRDQFNAATAAELAHLLGPTATAQAGVSPALMEFLEQDFGAAGVTLP